MCVDIFSPINQNINIYCVILPYLCVAGSNCIFSFPGKCFGSLLKLLVYSLITCTAMISASALFLSHAHLTFSRFIAFTAWYCILTLLCDAIANIHINCINSCGRVLAFQIKFLRFSFTAFVPDRRVLIARLIGKQSYGLMPEDRA